MMKIKHCELCVQVLHSYNVRHLIEIVSDFIVKWIIGIVPITSVVQQTVVSVVAGATSAQTFPGAWMTVLTVPGTRLFTKLAIKSKTFASFIRRRRKGCSLCYTHLVISSSFILITFCEIIREKLQHTNRINAFFVFNESFSETIFAWKDQILDILIHRSKWYRVRFI